MLMVDIIKKKRDGNVLSKEEIDFFIDGYVKGEIPDYQVSALLMAIYFNGLDANETMNLTDAMMHSGDVLDLSPINGVKVDKHSTGGVGDKTSLVLTPMVAALGIPVAKMSGRGLGHTGGTIDKLESFNGFSTGISIKQFFDNVNNIGLAIMGQTAELAPADKLLYALRDVTATVDNLSLIASSIMSKKLASGADAIVLDVKTGSGAFMKDEEGAKALAEKMVEIGTMKGVKTIAVISDMDQPLGYCVGNAIEVMEAIDTLSGNGPKDLIELCLTLGSQMVIAAQKADSIDEAKKMLSDTITDGTALKKLSEFIGAQGGNPDDVYHPERLPQPSISKEVKAECDGYVSHIQCDEIGNASLRLGGGRRSKEDVIDLAVGIRLKKKVGDEVHKGDTIAVLYANDENRIDDAQKLLSNAYSYSTEKPAARKFIKGIID